MIDVSSTELLKSFTYTNYHICLLSSYDITRQLSLDYPQASPEISFGELVDVALFLSN